VPEVKIAAITAMAVLSSFWVVVFSPMLDVRFSRRWYATALAAIAGISDVAAILSLRHLIMLEMLMVLSTATANLSSAALGGWLSNIAEHKDKNALSKWMNIAVISGTGVSSLLGGELIRNLPALAAAPMLGSIVFLPTVIFIFMPAPGPDGRLAAESFTQFSREVWILLRRREVVVVLLLFLSPCSSFALTNLLGALGDDFHASARAVSLAGGVGAFFPGIIGCFLFPIFAQHLPLRFFYLANGIMGSLFTLSLIVLPHEPWTFGTAVFGEFLFQAAAYAIQIGIVFEVIGPNNPLASTTFSVLTAATNVPITYVMAADGHAYSVATDALIGILTCMLASILLARFDSGSSTSTVRRAELIKAAPK
jgi:PAT family beta-lactamase induction signal transducer AmpG